MPSTKLVLLTGEQLEVRGPVEEIQRSLQDAARSTAGSLAWLHVTASDERVGVNPAHVVTVRAGDE